MKTVSIPEPVQLLTELYLRCGIATADSGHVPASGGRIMDVGHQTGIPV